MQQEANKLRDIKPVICEYISEALVMLKREVVPGEAAVHDVRVLMKKSRAAMKLLAPCLENEAFQREYLTFRDTGRALCKFRESSVHRKTLKVLKKQHRDLFLRLASNEKIASLMQKEDIHKVTTPEEKNSLANTIGNLSKAGFRVRFLSTGNHNTYELFSQLEKSYAIVCSDYLVCRNNSKPSQLHQLRKRLKDLLYQLWFFRPMNNTAVRALEKKIDGLTQNLGVYNDLAQFLEAVEYNVDDRGRSADMDELMILVRNRQDELLSKVWPVVYRLFCPGHKLPDLMGIEAPVNKGQPLPRSTGSGENNL